MPENRSSRPACPDWHELSTTSRGAGLASLSRLASAPARTHSAVPSSRDNAIAPSLVCGSKPPWPMKCSTCQRPRKSRACSPDHEAGVSHSTITCPAAIGSANASSRRRFSASASSFAKFRGDARLQECATGVAPAVAVRGRRERRCGGPRARCGRRNSAVRRRREPPRASQPVPGVLNRSVIRRS